MVSDVSEEAGFEQAFRRLYRPAFAVAYRIVGNVSDAEQAASEAMARAFASWRRVSALPYQDAWVMRVTANLAVDIVRRRPPPAPPLGAAGGLEDGAVLRLALGAALRRLPQRQRDVIVLRHLAGMTKAEVGAALGISVGAVHTHAGRARSSLRRLLGASWEGDSLAY
jgi:RNA polymerase sigma-70 factor (ECF subfamily)